MTDWRSRLVEPFLERRVLLALLAVTGCAWTFIAIADAAVGGASLGLDRALLVLLRRPDDLNVGIGAPWLESAMRDVTALGGWVVLTLVTTAVAGGLLLAGRRRQALFVVAAIVGAAVLADLIKDVFERPRPDLVPHGVAVSSPSFPSGHATQAAACYLTLGALLARFQPRRRLKAFTIGFAVIITLAVGLSRVYLGVHWPSDVLAGWTLGAAWGLTCWTVAMLLQRRGTVERADQPAPEEAPSS